jgi:hypothetical protein
MTDFLETIPGASTLIERFGVWPSFHDAEIVSLCLNRAGESTLVVHTFRMTSAINERGQYICDLHTLVTFSFGEILGMELSDFSHQNVIFGLSISQNEGAFELRLDPCYGLAGSIKTDCISITFEEGIPAGSIYTA